MFIIADDEQCLLRIAATIRRPSNHIDVTRITRTKLDNYDAKEIKDVWDGADGDVRKLRISPGYRVV